MKWVKKLFSKWSRKPVDWETLDYGKPSTAGDDFRKRNEV